MNDTALSVGPQHIQPTAPEPELLSTKAAAALLGIGERTLWRFSNCGRAPAPIKLGGAVRYRRRDLLAWIDDGCPDLREGGDR